MSLDRRADFPIFATHPNLTYLDSAATSQKPEAVIEAVSRFYRTSNANIHRGLYSLSLESTAQYEAARATVASFIGASSSREIIFTRSATESLNFLAATLSREWQKGDTIILSEMEHHANLVPWQEIARQRGLQIKFAKITEAGELDLEYFASLLDSQTRAVSLTHCSNVLGRLNPLAEIKKIMERQGSGALLIADACQSVVHFPISVQELGVDFLVFSGHKLYGPSGIGVLWGKEEHLLRLPPYQTGGDMVETVTFEHATWQDLPWRFEAGTPNIEGAIGLGAALEYLRGIGMENVRKHTAELAGFCRAELKKLPEVRILGEPEPASGIISFTVEDIHPHDLADFLAQEEVCIRAGHHCAAPLHAKLGLTGSNRVSIGIYTNIEEIERFLSALQEAIKAFNHA